MISIWSARLITFDRILEHAPDNREEIRMSTNHDIGWTLCIYKSVTTPNNTGT